MNSFHTLSFSWFLVEEINPHFLCQQDERLEREDTFLLIIGHLPSIKNHAITKK